MSASSSVSVVIPTYNRAAILPDALHSVLQQTLPAEEILVIDDGSTDSTADVATAFGPPVRWIRQENAGVAAARNRGMRESHGRYIAFLDSDDMWAPDFLSAHLEVLRLKSEVGWSCTGLRAIDASGTPLVNHRGLADEVPFFDHTGLSPEQWFAARLPRVTIRTGAGSYEAYCGDVYEMLFGGNFVFPSSVVMRRRVFEEVGGFDESLRVAEDTEYFHRLAAGYQTAVIPAPLLRRRAAQSDSLTATRNTVLLIRNALLSVDRAIQLRPQPTSAAQEAYRDGRARLLHRLAYAQLSLLDRSGARHTLLEGWHRGMRVSLRTAALFAAACLPSAALNGLHGLKRMVVR